MKKFVYSFLILFILSAIFIPNVEAKTNFSDVVSIGDYSITSDYNRDDDFAHNCADFAHTIRIGGYLVNFVKVLLPFIIMVKATISFISVVTSAKPEELKKKASKLGVSLGCAVAIFFIPTIVNIVFGFIAGFNDNITEDSKICSACIFEPFSETCTKYAD